MDVIATQFPSSNLEEKVALWEARRPPIQLTYMHHKRKRGKRVPMALSYFDSGEYFFRAIWKHLFGLR